METVWFAVVLIALLTYVILDGYDLGAGTISLFTRDKRTRHDIVEEVATVWDGNETWLVLAAVTLWAGFPVAFGVILPHVYIPMILALFALIVRGFSVEYISQLHGRVANGWFIAFGAGSLAAAFLQGVVLGSLTAPIAFAGVDYLGGPFDGLTWYSLLMGLTVVAAYVALGYSYLHPRGVGDPQQTATRGRYAIVVTGVLALASVLLVRATPAGLRLDHPARTVAFCALLLLACIGLAISYARLCPPRKDPHGGLLPLAGLAVAIVAIAGAFVATHAPEIVPGLTLQNASVETHAFDFLFVGVLINLPLIVFYNWYARRALGRRPSPASTATKEVATHA